MRYLLNRPIKSEEIEFINETEIPLELNDPSLLGPTDSGWCDAPTGARILTSSMRVTFTTDNPLDATFLKTKFLGDLLILD